MTDFQKKGIFRFTVVKDVPLIVGSAFCLVMSSLGAPLETFLYGKIFAKLAQFLGGTYHNPQSFLKNISFFCGQIVIIAAVRMALSWIGIIGSLLAGERAQMRGRQAVFWYLLSKDLQSLEAKDNLVGSLTQVHRSIEEIRAGVSENLGVLLQTCASIIFLFVTSMISLWQLTFVVIASSPLMALSSFCFGLLAVKYGTLENSYSAEASKVLDWCFSSGDISRILNGKYFDTARYTRNVELSATAFTRTSASIEANSAVLRALGSFVFVQGLIFAEHLISVKGVNVGQIFTSFSACLLLGSLIASLADLLAMINRAQASSKSIDLLGFPGLGVQSPPPSICKDNFVVPVSKVVLDKISFHYQIESAPVLHEISAQFDCSCFNFVVGLSGSGKSTLACILAGLFQQTSGNLFFDNLKPCKSEKDAFDGTTLINLHSAIFKRLLRDNLLAGADHVKDDNAILRALHFAGLQDFVYSLPNGMDTIIDCGQLSGGQTQKIGLARAYLRDSPILILDEALSAIDVTCRRDIMNRLREARSGKLTIIVTHDGQDIDNEDAVLLLGSGKVLAAGKAAKLRHDIPTKDTQSKEEIAPLPEKVDSMLLWLEMRRADFSDVEKQTVSEDANEIVKPLSIPSVLGFCFKTSENKLLILFGSVTAVAIGFTPAILSFLFSRTLAELFSQKSTGMLFVWRLLVPAIIVIPVDGVLFFSSKLSLSYSLERWIVCLRKKCLAIISDQDMTFFRAEHLSANDLTTLLMNDTRDMRNVLSELVPGLLQMIALLLGGIVWSLFTGWKLTLAGLSFVILCFIFSVGYGIILQNVETQYKSSIATLERFCSRTLSSIRTVKSLQLSDDMIREYDSMISSTAVVGLKRAIADGFGESVLQLCTSAASATILYYGVHLVSTGQYGMQQMLLVLTMLMFVIGGLTSLVKRLPAVSRGQRATRLISRLLTYRPLPLETGGELDLSAKVIKALKTAVCFKNVTFSYLDVSGRRFNSVLRGLNFEISKGESVALVGLSGCGKSTIGSLLLKLFETDRGSIEVFGMAINDINGDKYRATVVSVPQTPKFFEGTLRDNLIYGSSSSYISDDTINAALQAANVLDIVNKLANRLDTKYGSEVSFSLGELQRLCIARALVRRPRVIVFDEPTSHLDSINSKVISDMIEGGLKYFDQEVTILTITHDPQIMRRSARILVVDNGAISQDGTYNQLSCAEGPFKELLKL